jgi:hypothetical protein
MKFETWTKKYAPIKNKLSKGAPIDGYMFETFGKQLKELLKQANKKKIDGRNGYRVWTVVDGEGSSLILINGWHLVNRLGYMITRKPWTEGEYIEVRV